jgi:hypothetical protein
MARHTKFDDQPALRLQPYESMFQPVADLLSWKDLEEPVSGHTAKYPAWREEAEVTLSEVVEETLTPAEEESFEVGKTVGFRLLEKFVEKATAVGWASQTPEMRRAAAEAVLSQPQIPQRSQAWYAQGKEVLTASEFGNLFGSPRCVSQLVMSKVPQPLALPHPTNRLACMTCEMGPFDWGIRFEPVVKQILASKWGVEIAEAGRIVHPTDTNLAASPDGIILAATDPKRVGRLLEIKCPVSRAIGEGVPFDYWCQMQIQMEVTGIEECEYVEVKLDSIQGQATDLSGSAPAIGYVWLYQQPTTCEMSYAYTEAEGAALKAKGLELLETIPWRIHGIFAKTVTRDRAWFKGTEELRATFWKNVEKARKGEFQVVEARQRTPKSGGGGGGNQTPTVIVTKSPSCLIIDES